MFAMKYKFIIIDFNRRIMKSNIIRLIQKTIFNLNFIFNLK